MSRRIFSLIILFLWYPKPVLSQYALNEGAASVTPPPKSVLKQEYRETEQRVELLQKGLEDQETSIKASRDQQASILGELEDLNAMLAEGKVILAELYETMLVKEQLVKEREKQLGEANTEYDRVRVRVQRRLAAYQRMDSVSIINIAFAAESLPELLALDDTFRFLLSHDKEIFQEYRLRQSELLTARSDMEEEMRRLADAVRGIEMKKTALTELRVKKENLLARVRTEEALYQQAHDEIRASAEELARMLADLKCRIAAPVRIIADPPKKKKLETGSLLAYTAPLPDFSAAQEDIDSPDASFSATSFSSLKGKLPLPARGEIVTSFGNKSKGKFGIAAINNGIDIKTDPGTPVHAFYRGKIVYSGVLRGYGNLVIIDHGDQYYSLLSRLEKLLKKEGQHVAEGEVVGYTGETNRVLGEGLHLEIRHGTEPVDPLSWIATGSPH